MSYSNNVSATSNAPLVKTFALRRANSGPSTRRTIAGQAGNNSNEQKPKNPNDKRVFYCGKWFNLNGNANKSNLKKINEDPRESTNGTPISFLATNMNFNTGYNKNTGEVNKKQNEIPKTTKILMEEIGKSNLSPRDAENETKRLFGFPY